MRLISLIFFLPLLLTAQDPIEISGQILDAATRQPIPRAHVVLLRMGPGVAHGLHIFDTPLSPADPPADSAAFSFQTTEQGNFLARTIAPATFMIFVSHPGYAQYGNSIETQHRITLKAGARPERLTIALEPEGSISGRLLDAETGAPIRGFQVEALRWRISNGSRGAWSSGESKPTSDEGAYEIPGLVGAEYLLRVIADPRRTFRPGGGAEDFRDHREVAYGPTWYPGVDTHTQASTVTLLRGAALTGTHIKLARRRLASIRGQIRLAAGESLDGPVALSLGRRDEDLGVISLQSVATGSFSAGASFRLDGLPPGHYWLQATPAGTAPQPALTAFTFFDLDDRNVDNLDLTLARGLDIPGRLLLHESITTPLAELLPATQQPRVSIFCGDRMSLRTEAKPAPAATDGTFRLTGVLDSPYRVGVIGLPKTLTIGEVRYNGAPVPRRRFTPNRSALEQKLEIVLVPATASIQVTVTTGTRPAPGVPVILMPEGEDPASRSSMFRTTPSDDTGHATFANLAAGKYRVIAFTSGSAWRTSPQLAQTLTVNAKAIELTNGATVALELKPTTIE